VLIAVQFSGRIRNRPDARIVPEINLSRLPDLAGGEMMRENARFFLTNASSLDAVVSSCLHMAAKK